MPRKSKRVSRPRKTKSSNKRTKRPRSSKKKTTRKRRRTLKKMKNMKGGAGDLLDEYLFTYSDMIKIKNSLTEGQFLFYFKDSQKVGEEMKIRGLLIKVNNELKKIRFNYKETDTEATKTQANNLFKISLYKILKKYLEGRQEIINLSEIFNYMEPKPNIQINPMNFIKPEQVVPTPNEPNEKTLEKLKRKEQELQPLQEELQTLQEQLQTLQKQLQTLQEQLKKKEEELQPLQKQNFKEQYPYLDDETMKLYSLSVDPIFLNKYNKDTYVYDDSLIKRMNKYSEELKKGVLIQLMKKL